jgi:hypothetical protein
MSAPRAAIMSTLTHRDRAILRAVATGSAELVAGADPTCTSTGSRAATSSPPTASCTPD